jgi:hypothetical protein
MKTKVWALVTSQGYISLRTARHTRKDVIECLTEQYKGLRNTPRYQWLDDEQFWRKLKRRYGWKICRVSVEVL